MTLYIAYMSDATEKWDEFRSSQPNQMREKMCWCDTSHQQVECLRRAHAKGGGAAPKGRGQGEEGLLSSHASLSLSLFSQSDLFSIFSCIHR